MKCGGSILDEGGNNTDKVCGCAITGEVHRKRHKDGSYKEHIYWHCSNTTTTCSQQDKARMKAKGLSTFYKQNILEAMLEEIFGRLHFTDDDCKWMQKILLEHQSEESQKHEQKLLALHGRLKMLSRYIDEAYTDKVEGKITENLWRQNNEKRLLERDQINNEISAMDDKKQEHIQKGVLLIELAQRTVSIYQNTIPEAKRKLLDLVSSNLVLKDGTIDYLYRKPFDLLAEGSSKEKWWRRRKAKYTMSPPSNTP
jgi:hypothetical protein